MRDDAAVPTEITLPSQADPVARAASESIGGPVGRHARVGDRGFWTPVRVVVAVTLLFATLGWLQKAPCRTHPWVEGYQNSRLCYNDYVPLYGVEGLNTGKTPYVDHPVEYPVLIGGLMFIGGKLSDNAADFYDVTALMMVVAALVVAATTVRAAGHRPWDAMMFATSLALIFHTTTNWDLVAVAFTGLGLAAWARRKPGWAGVWWGLGIATKIYPAFFAIPLLALCIRTRRVGAWFTTAAAAVGVWLVVNVPVILVAGNFVEDNGVVRAALPGEGGENGWLRFWTLSRERGANWESIWYMLERVRHKALDTGGGVPSRLNLAVLLSFVLAIGAITALALFAPRRPRLAQLLFLTVASFLFINKVYSPQYVLWLTPLALLARPRWGAFLLWQVAEVVQLVFQFTFFLNLADAPKGTPLTWFQVASLGRFAALGALMGLVVREILHPEHDVVRDGGHDDPAGGLLDGAPDREPRQTGKHAGAYDPAPV